MPPRRGVRGGGNMPQRTHAGQAIYGGGAKGFWGALLDGLLELLRGPRVERLERLLLLPRGGGVALLQLRDGETHARLRVIGPQADGLREGFGGLLRSVQLVVGIAEVVEGVGILRVEARGRLEGFGCLRLLVQAVVDVAHLEVRVGVLRVQYDG